MEYHCPKRESIDRLSSARASAHVPVCAVTRLVDAFTFLALLESGSQVKRLTLSLPPPLLKTSHTGVSEEQVSDLLLAPETGWKLVYLRDTEEQKQQKGFAF